MSLFVYNFQQIFKWPLDVFYFAVVIVVVVVAVIKHVKYLWLTQFFFAFLTLATVYDFPKFFLNIVFIVKKNTKNVYIITTTTATIIC